MIYLKNLNTQASVNYQSSAEGEVHQGRGGVNKEVVKKKILFFTFHYNRETYISCLIYQRK